MAADRRQGNVAKEEPQVLWQDRDIAVLSKGAGWIVAISREIEQNKLLSGLLRSAGTRDVRDLVNSGKYEHLCHYVNLKFREDKDYVLATSNEHEFGLAHRLDVDTSGALMLGKSLQGFHHLRQAFTSHQVFKEYICLVHGAVKKSTDQVNLPIAWDEQNNISSISDQGMWAKSIYTVLGRYRVKGGKKVFTLCRVVIITGRTHQIRIHMAAIGHPLVGDGKYNKRHAQTDFMWCPRLFLHAWRIGFWDCWGAWHEVKAPLPRDVSRSLKTLEAVQLDLDNSGNPSCRILTATVPSRETTTPIVSGQTGFKEAPPTPLPKPPPPPPKALPNVGVTDQASRTEPLSGPVHGKYGLGGPVPRVPEGPQPQLLPPVSMTDYEASPAVHVDLPSSGPFHLPCSPPPPPPKRQGGGDLEHVALAGSPKEPAPAGIRAEGGGHLEEDPAGRQSRTDVGCRRSSGKDQAHLEELCCEVAKRTLLDLPMYQCSVGQLGCMREVAPVLQQMGFRRPTLSKILRDRPETFEVVGEVNSEQIVTLRLGARAREQTGVPLASCCVSDSSVRPGSFEELQQMDAESLRSRSEDWPTPALARRPAVAPWCIDYQSYEEPCATLVEMGFERQSALRALQVNHGNLMEAMDQLSSQPMPALDKPAAERSRSSKLSPEPLKASLASQASQDGSGSAGKWAAATTQSEEELLQRALVLSQREEEDRQRRQEMDESALAAALADSLRPGSRLPTADDDDLQLKEALEQSRLLEDDVRRQALLEEEEVECAIRESMQNYELFHACGSDALEETLKHSLEECSAEELEWQASWEAIQTAYNESSGGPEDDLAHFVAVERDTDSSLKAGDEGEMRGSGLRFPPTANSPCTLGSEVVAEALDALDAGIQGPRSTEGPNPAASLDLHTWLLRRVQELEVELDGHVLWTVVNELEETLLGDDDVLKMWLGFMAEEPLPTNIKRLLTDFKQRKESLRSQTG